MDLDLLAGDGVGPGANVSEPSAPAELLEPELPGGAGGGGTNMKCTACGKVVSKEEVTKCVNLHQKVMCDEVCLKVQPWPVTGPCGPAVPHAASP